MPTFEEPAKNVSLVQFKLDEAQVMHADPAMTSFLGRLADMDLSDQALSKIGRDPSEGAEVSRFIDSLSAYLAPEIMPRVGAALHAETEGLLNSGWAETAFQAARRLFPESGTECDEHHPEDRAAACGGREWFASQEEVQAHTNSLLCVLLSTWLEGLRQLVRRRGPISLDEHMLPSERSIPSLQKAINSAMAPYAIGERDVAGIMGLTFAAIFGNGARELFVLPFELELRLDPGGRSARVISIRASER